MGDTGGVTIAGTADTIAARARMLRNPANLERLGVTPEPATRIPLQQDEFVDARIPVARHKPSPAYRHVKSESGSLAAPRFATWLVAAVP